MSRDLVTLITKCIRNFPHENGGEDPVNLTANSALFGKEGLFDSIGLVSLVVAVEQEIEDVYGISISLADERALSQKSSPYQTINSLAEYAERLIQRQS